MRLRRGYSRTIDDPKIRDGLQSYRIQLIGGVLFLFLAAGALASYVEYQNTDRVIKKHVFVWEEDIAHDLLIKNDSRLLEKVKLQIPDISKNISAVMTTLPKVDDPRCSFVHKTPITLYGTPGSIIYSCQSRARVVIAGLSNPIFFILFFLGFLFLIWRDRRIEHESLRLNMATKTARALEQLAKQVAHDIRSPAGALQIVSDDIQHRLLDETNKILNPHLALLQNAILRITRIADDLLDPHTKYQQRSACEIMTPKSILATVSAVIEEKKVQMTDSEIRFSHNKINYHESFDTELALTSNHGLARVVSNLIQNAVEAPRASGTTKTIKIDLQPIGKRKFQISIEDNGLGMNRSTLRRLGHRGVSLNKTNGTGLGVYSAAQWARDHNGTLSYQTTPRSGTKASLEFQI